MGLDTVEIVMELEQKFDISLPDVILQSVRTVGDLADCVYSQLQNSGSILSRDEVGARVVAIVSEELGCKPGEVKEESRFAEDLNAG